MDTVLRWRDQVQDGVMSVANFIWNCGIHYGYKPCCVKNYINLKKLGYAPAMFMSVVLGDYSRAGHVLCSMCAEEWDGEAREPEYDLTRVDVVDRMKEYKLIRDNL
jgi:hypothetical protein